MPRPSRETCQICFRPNPVGFHVPNEIWEDSVPETLRYSVLCMNCFAALADERLVQWDERIEFYPVSAASMLEDIYVT